MAVEQKEQLALSVISGGESVEFHATDLRQLSDGYTRSVYPEDWYEKMADRSYERMQYIARDPQSVLIFDDDRLIGLQGWKEAGIRADGTHIAELTLASVNPEYRGERLGSILKYSVERTIEGFYGNAPFVIVGVSRTPQVVESALRRGYYEVDLERLYVSHNDVRLGDVDEMRELGFTGFELSTKTMHPDLVTWRERVEKRIAEVVS